jgi:hypothetical protein
MGRGAQNDFGGKICYPRKILFILRSKRNGALKTIPGDNVRPYLNYGFEINGAQEICEICMLA